MYAQVLVHVGERRVACREVPVAPPGPGEVRVESLCSAISPGTEALVFRGAFPEDVALDSAIPSLAGRFSYPFPYGYAVVGTVAERGAGVDACWQGAQVFVFHPHQSRMTVPLDQCQPLPPQVSPEDALLLPQVETALNLIQDAAPLIGEHVLVFGLGLVGLLTSALLARFPLGRLLCLEPLEGRRTLAAQWGLTDSCDPQGSVPWKSGQAPWEGADLAFELSGSPEALDQAIEAMGFDGRIVVGSWYGRQRAPIDLGGPFHRNRLRLVSSQVSTVAPALSGRWNKARRFELAWQTVQSLDTARLPRRAFQLEQCQQAFETLCDRRDEAVQRIFRY